MVYNYRCYFRSLLGGSVGSAIIKDGSPFAVHYVMFIPTIMGQGTLEQQGEWVGRAFSNQIIGTYAQVFYYLEFDI